MELLLKDYNNLKILSVFTLLISLLLKAWSYHFIKNSMVESSRRVSAIKIGRYCVVTLLFSLSLLLVLTMASQDNSFPVFVVGSTYLLVKYYLKIIDIFIEEFFSLK